MFKGSQHRIESTLQYSTIHTTARVSRQRRNEDGAHDSSGLRQPAVSSLQRYAVTRSCAHIGPGSFSTSHSEVSTPQMQVFSSFAHLHETSCPRSVAARTSLVSRDLHRKFSNSPFDSLVSGGYDRNRADGPQARSSAASRWSFLQTWCPRRRRTSDSSVRARRRTTWADHRDTRGASSTESYASPPPGIPVIYVVCASSITGGETISDEGLMEK